MIGLEYLIWILFTGLCCFIAVRLYWIYQRHRYHLFWKRPGARQYIFVATLLLFSALAVVLMRWPNFYLLPLAVAIYWLCTLAAVKISERGIFAGGMMARWLDIIQVRHLSEKNQYCVITNKSWRRLRFEVPAEIEAPFRKMLALQKIPVLQEEQTAAHQPSPASHRHPLTP